MTLFESEKEITVSDVQNGSSELANFFVNVITAGYSIDFDSKAHLIMISKSNEIRYILNLLTKTFTDPDIPQEIEPIKDENYLEFLCSIVDYKLKE